MVWHAELSYVLGLDWAGKGRWAYCRLAADGKGVPEIGVLPAAGAAHSTLIEQALSIVADSPIGLPDCRRTAQLRPCDRGARNWVGTDLGGAILAVVSCEECSTG